MVISVRKQDRIKKLWDEGWSLGAICEKVNVTQYIVYQYIGKIPIARTNRNRRNKFPKGHLPPALQKRVDMERKQ